MDQEENSTTPQMVTKDEEAKVIEQLVIIIKDGLSKGKNVKDLACLLMIPRENIVKIIFDNHLEEFIQDRAFLPWKQTEDDQLKSELETELSFDQIAKIHKRTACAISCRAKLFKRTQISKPKKTSTNWSPEEIEKLKSLIEAGNSWQEISISLGRSYQVVYGKCYRTPELKPYLKMTKRVRPLSKWSPKEMDLLDSLIFQCKKPKEITTHFNRGYNSVSTRYFHRVNELVLAGVLERKTPRDVPTVIPITKNPQPGRVVVVHHHHTHHHHSHYHNQTGRTTTDTEEEIWILDECILV